jgi:hypothetical protein
MLDIHVYWIILTMHGPIKFKSPNNTSKWQMGFNSAFKGLILSGRILQFVMGPSVISIPRPTRAVEPWKEKHLPFNGNDSPIHGWMDRTTLGQSENKIHWQIISYINNYIYCNMWGKFVAELLPSIFGPKSKFWRLQIWRWSRSGYIADNMAVTSGQDWYQEGKEKVIPPYGKYFSFGR